MIRPVNQSKVAVQYVCATVQSGGTVVALDPANAGQVIPVSTATQTQYGILAQDVIAVTTDLWKLDSETQRARVSGAVGVYYDEGQFIMCSGVGYIGSPTIGSLLYANIASGSGPLGWLTTVSGTSMAPVGICEVAGIAASGNNMQFRSLL